MRAWADMVRRLAAGLALLAILALTLSQAMALPRIDMPCGDDTPQSAPSVLGQAGHHEAGTPGPHGKAHATLVCCLAGDCVVAAPAVASASFAIPAELPAASYQDAMPTAFEGLGTHPAVPPPRLAI